MSKGGSPPAPPAPVVVNQPPPAGESTREALQSELEFRPQFREQDVQDILSLGQAAADLYTTSGFDVARKERALFEELEPETFQALKSTSQAIVDRLGQPLSPQMEEAYRERFRSEEALGGRLGSPVGSATIARQLAEVEEGNKTNAISAGLSYLGRAPLGVPNLPVERGTNMGSLVGPTLSYNAGNYSTQLGYAGSVYGNQLGYRAASNQNRAQMIGAGIGALGQLGAAGIYACLPDDAMIETEEGEVAVKDLRVGDVVIGGTIIAIQQVKRRPGHRFHKVVTTDGVVIMSPGHPTMSKRVGSEPVDHESDCTYDILTTTGGYRINKVWVLSTMTVPVEVADGV